LSSDRAAARPRLTPCWKLAKRFRIASADLGGATGPDVVTEPGTRFFPGTRFGSPEAVRPEARGARIVASATRQPSSPGDRHAGVEGVEGVELVEPDAGDLRWNHSDSIASKMGNRSSRLIGPVDSTRSQLPVGPLLWLAAAPTSNLSPYPFSYPSSPAGDGVAG
jgi:hypothetical protein